MTETIHATCVAIKGRGLLITGPSGSGKSDLALRLLDRGAALVSDDYTKIDREDDRLVARAPASIAGLIEVRGVGILPWPHLDGVEVGLMIDLEKEPERMPEPCSRILAGLAIRSVALDPFETSAPIKVELAARTLWSRAH